MKKAISHIIPQAFLLLLLCGAAAGASGFEENGRHPVVALVVIAYVCLALIAAGVVEVMRQ